MVCIFNNLVFGNNVNIMLRSLFIPIGVLFWEPRFEMKMTSVDRGFPDVKRDSQKQDIIDRWRCNDNDLVFIVYYFLFH